MNAEKLLVPYCWAFVGVMALLIVVPYLRRRSELVSAWNLFLVGSMNFIGVAGLKAGYSSREFRIFEYTKQDYQSFLFGVTTFYVVLVICYYGFKFPERLAGRALRKWPPASSAVLFFMLPFTLVLSAGAAFPPDVVGLAQVAVQIGNKAMIFALTFAFIAWFKQRGNPVLMLTLGVVLLNSIVLGIMTGGTRRGILSVMVTIPICWYWLSLRYKTPKFTLGAMAASGALVLALMGAYSQVRHFDRQGDRRERNYSGSMLALKELPSRLTDPGVEEMLGQNAVQLSLATIHLYREQMRPAPFHALKFVFLVPIPRAIWPEKPVGLGYSLPKDCKARGTRATWGPGVVGHGFHEGGLHMLAFYGALCGIALRFFDSLLIRQASNPYLLGAFCAMSSHIVGWPRGDIGTFTVQIVSCMLAGILLGIVGRLAFGTGTVYPRTDYVLPGGGLRMMPT